MIFYFTGTGNSYYIANKIAIEQNENIISIANEMKKEEQERTYTIHENEMVGFVYPIYAWGPPQILLDFIHSIKFEGDLRYVFSLATCGGEVGHATQIVQRALESIGISLASAYSVKMPSNYVVGADVEDKQTQDKKCKEADLKLIKINHALNERRVGEFDLSVGKYAIIKSGIIYLLFNKFARRTTPFYATDACIECGLCQTICPVQTITLSPTPKWGKECTQCLGCINCCPVHAIEYGKATIYRGRYLHPEYQRIIKKHS